MKVMNAIAKVRGSAARLGEAISEWDWKFGSVNAAEVERLRQDEKDAVEYRRVLADRIDLLEGLLLEARPYIEPMCIEDDATRDLEARIVAALPGEVCPVNGYHMTAMHRDACPACGENNSS